jgi:tetratricopeptide (TPR) repeat protein
MPIQIAKLLFRTAPVLIALLSFCLCGQAQDSGASASSYDELVVDASRLLKQGKLDEARQTAQQAIQKNANGYMAYAVAAKIASEQGAGADVAKFIQKALQLAPDDDTKAKVRQLAAMLDATGAQAQSPAPGLSDEDRLTLNVLNLMLEKADGAATPEARAQVCEEILRRSEDLGKRHPEQTNIWVMRGVAAVVLGRAHEGFEAGQHLKALGMMHSQDPEVGHLFAELELNCWLNEEPTTPKPGQRWTNMLGQVFVPLPETSLLMCIWDTRVQDFATFVDDTGYDATEGLFSLGSDEWKSRGDTWKNPGFAQLRTCPVCGVSWEDAQAFCKWLTEKERRRGLLGANQSYRLPWDVEWSMAVGNEKYPWGDQWPPPAGAGNYAGSEAADENWPGAFGSIPGYRDGFARTSPVGSFAPNSLGLFDMGGNVWQWCEDWYKKEMNTAEILEKAASLANDGGGQQFHVLRGGSWFNYDSSYPQSAFRFRLVPGNRCTFSGFRCVLVAGAGVR